MAPSERRPTEQPTSRRISGARERGQVAVSADLSGALGLAALVTLLAGLAPAGFSLLASLFRRSLALAAASGRAGTATDNSGDVGAIATARLATAAWRACEAMASLLLAPFAVAIVVTLASGVIQTGGLFAWHAVAVDGRRLSPASGLRRLFGPAILGSLGKTTTKVALVFVAATVSLAPLAGELPRLTGARPASVLTALGTLSQRVAVHVALAFLGWGIIDWLIARHRHRRALMMTREEARREHRETEGDPRPRAERQRLHREVSARAMNGDDLSE